MTLPLSPEIGPDLDKFLELGAYMFFSLRSDMKVSVRPDRYPRHFQGSRSSTFVIL